MDIKIKFKNFNTQNIIRNIQLQDTLIAGAVAKYTANYIKDEIWKAQDTQTGRERKRKFGVGGIQANSNDTIIGSRFNEWPNIESSKLVESITSKTVNTVPGLAKVEANTAGSSIDNYAGYINERNQFLKRGFVEKRLTIQKAVAQLHYLNQLKKPK